MSSPTSEGRLERREAGDWLPMWTATRDLEAPSRVPVHRPDSVLDRYAELGCVRRRSRSWRGIRCHIGVDAKAAARPAPSTARRDSISASGTDSRLNWQSPPPRASPFPRRLADPEIRSSRLDSGGAGPPILAARDDVGPEPSAASVASTRGIRIGLDRISVRDRQGIERRSQGSGLMPHPAVE